MTTWIRSLLEWDGRLPVALVLRGADAGERRAALRSLAARAAGMAAAEIEVLHEDGRAPRLRGPAASRLHLSSASRSGWAALAVAAQPVGIDIEEVTPPHDPPWRVLHPDEAVSLARLTGLARARAFARLWTVKEAYLKALGTGLAREPASFAVRSLDAERAAIDDPLSSGQALHAESRWIDEVVVASIGTIDVG